jgi:hypothetical protein
MAKNTAMERRAVAEVFQKYPKSRSVHSIQGEVTWGFDIGIASLWRRSGEIDPVAEWQRVLGGLGA